MLGLFFTAAPVRRLEDVDASDRALFARVFHRLLAHGVHLPPSPYEALFVSTAHGEAEIADLAPQFREASEKLQVGEVSEPIRTSAGMHLIAVCGRRMAGAQEVNKEQIEQRLFSQQLSMIARRYMRDLRNSATIETR